MDPKACLLHSLDCSSAGDLDEASCALANYHAWRGRGGFEPTILWGGSDIPGDTFAASLEGELAEMYAQNEES